MKNSKFFKAKLILALAFVASLFFTGCQQPSDDSQTSDQGTSDEQQTTEIPSIHGTWVSSFGEKYVIDLDNKTFTNYWKDSEGYSEGYAGSIWIIKTYWYDDDEYSTEGDIIMKYTRSMNSDYTYSETAPDVGKYYIVHYSDLTTNSVKISGAYKAGGKTSTDRPSEAMMEFTEDNGYFSAYSECVKQ